MHDRASLVRSASVLDVRYFNQPHRTGRRRSIEWQGRLHGFDPIRITGFDRDGAADAVLPDSRLSAGPKALGATWFLHVRAVGLHGARHQAEWLLLLEDDALLIPGFVQRAEAALAQVPDDCLLVQLGFLSKYTWFSGRRLWLNAVMAGLFIVRGEWRPNARLQGGGDDPRFSRDLLVGSHATAVRVSTIPELLEILQPFEHATDDLFRARAQTHPGRFLRSRRQLAIQAPLFRSDLVKERRRIAAARRARLQAR